MSGNLSETTPRNPQVAQVAVLRLFWASKRFIVINFFVVAILAAGFSLLLPNWYQSFTSVLPSSAGSGESIMGGIGSLSPLAAFMGSGATEELNNYISILKSRNVREQVIHEFNLMEVYHAAVWPLL